MTRGSKQIRLDTSPKTAWEALVSPDRHRWYFRLTPEGEFAEGKKISWRDGSGSPAEESEVIEVKAPRRLVMRTRYLFAPAFAQQEPHTVTWQVSRSGKGSRVSLSWDANEVVAGLLDAEGDNILKALHLEHDSAAQADLARLLEIGEIQIQDVTPDRVADYREYFDEVAFRDNPSWQSCYCMETHRTQTDEEWAVRTAADNRRDMSAGIKEGRVTALLAYVDGKPVGWCNYGETTRLNGVMHRFGLNVAEQQGVGSLACFVIAAPYRKHGVAAALLEAALDRMRARGVRVAEAYPARDRDSPQSNYRGPLQMFLRAGFEPYRETERHLILRKTL
ncbi:MAG TPA: GNAT family N-acetyltransferase [Candidatus Dormibacteraeota bacterium]|nr:GNAT family N-acetyltransferase [Candidatus Dormibacteraeota bacterium]HEX2679863.1 GNAT family N-acetyltransferase [Candidatus Dormibacteraeota bacterium]